MDVDIGTQLVGQRKTSVALIQNELATHLAFNRDDL